MLRWILLLSAMLLCACSNQVLSDTLLVDAGEQPAATVRPGRWTMLGSGCVDRAPPMAWADCAEVALFDGAVVLFGDRSPVPVRLGAGAPTILQAHQIGDRLVGRRLNDLARVQQGKPPSRTGPEPPYFLYYVVEPLRRNSQGQIVDLRLRSVQCGPPRPSMEGTDHPAAGLAMDEEDNNCIAAGRAALSAAARATLDRPNDHMEQRYVWVSDLTEQDRARIAQSTIAE